METLLVVIFVIGYLAITLEHNLKIDKLIPALAMMAILWALMAFGIDGFSTWFDSGNHSLLENFGAFGHEEKMELMEETLLHHLGKTSEILVFLLGAMTIVEIIDYFDGFATIKSFVKTRSKKKILWIFSFLAFILSAIIDNLTATIVLISILQKIVKDREVRIWYAGLIIIAANAGGAWSPIGDVTTTMLWIGDKVSTAMLIEHLLIPSLVCMLIPSFIASFLPAFKGEIDMEEEDGAQSKFGPRMLYLGLGAIVFVPIFKTVTHLPPYVGMMLSLAVVATFAEIYSNKKIAISSLDQESDAHASHSPVHSALTKIELPSILFFLGILMAVAALESLGLLFNFAEGLKQGMPLIGTEMAGTRVSDLVVILLGVGSAAGVVAMGMEKIDFFWYLKKISWLAFVGFIAGAICYMGMRYLF